MNVKVDDTTGPTGKDRVFSGIQPSGNIHIGNYLGAIQNWVKQQDENENIYCIVDLHALSLPTDPRALQANIRNLANTYLACGLDPNKNLVFVQSDVPEHTEACWLLGSIATMGELRRMTQYKDKAGPNDGGVSSALFTYPILMACDILLYDAKYVPVGDDQKQHIELTRDLAQRFNARYGDTFVMPNPDIKKDGARIMSLDDPSKKMSKSNPVPGSYIALSDTPDVIRKKLKRAVTDSDATVRAGDDKPAVTNLMTIYSLMTDLSLNDVERRFEGKGYGPFKSELAEVVVERIAPIQERILEFEKDPSIVDGILESSAERARAIAGDKVAEMRRKMGIGGVPRG